MFRGGGAAANDPVEENINPAIVYSLRGGEVLKLYPVLFTGTDVLPEKIIIPPGAYTFSGKSYSLVQEGLYQFVVPGKMNVQRIVYRDDLDAFLSAISWIVTHGNSYDKKSLPVLSNKALNSKLFIMVFNTPSACGGVTD